MQVPAGNVRPSWGDGHRHAVESDVAAHRVVELLVGEQVGVDTPVLLRHAQLHAGHALTEAVWDAHDAGPDGVGDLDVDRHLTDTRPDRGGCAGGQAQPIGVVGVDLERASVLALREHPDVVHPRVVRSHMAATDEHHRLAPVAIE